MGDDCVNDNVLVAETKPDWLAATETIELRYDMFVDILLCCIEDDISDVCSR